MKHRNHIPQGATSTSAGTEQPGGSQPREYIAPRIISAEALEVAAAGGCDNPPAYGKDTSGCTPPLQILGS